jgi:PAS domain S-box-containing protein
MGPISSRIWSSYGTAIVSVAAVVLLKLLISSLFQVDIYFALFLGAVFFSSWFGGVGPGLLATVLSMLTADFFFLPPLHNLFEYNAEQSLRVVQFGAEGVFISFLSGLRHHYIQLLHRRFEELRVTLNSIADAVITTDARGAVDFLNPVAETLTGWTAAEAARQPLTEILNLVDENSGAAVELPVAKIIQSGRPAGFADRVFLVARDGTRRAVGGSAAPITGTLGQYIGAVLVLYDVTEQRLAEGKLRAELLSRLASIQEDERRRIARELHDETGQQLTALILALKAARDRPEMGGDLAADLALLQEQADLIGRGMHRLAWELRPTALDDLGLETALRDSVERWSERARIPVDFHCALGEGRLPVDLETHLYRITQEALTNVMRHARATRASVILERRRDDLLAIVEDNGRGFDPEAVRQAARAEHKLGLFGMQERVALMGGSLTIETSPGQGTTVFVRVPLNGQKGAASEEDSRLVGR